METCADGGGCIYNRSTTDCVTFCVDDSGSLFIERSDVKGSYSDFLDHDNRIDLSFRGVNPFEISRLIETLGDKRKRRWYHRLAKKFF